MAAGVAGVSRCCVLRRRGHQRRARAAHQRSRTLEATRLCVQRHILQLRRGFQRRVQGNNFELLHAVRVLAYVAWHSMHVIRVLHLVPRSTSTYLPSFCVVSLL